MISIIDTTLDVNPKVIPYGRNIRRLLSNNNNTSISSKAEKYTLILLNIPKVWMLNMKLLCIAWEYVKFNEMTTQELKYHIYNNINMEEALRILKPVLPLYLIDENKKNNNVNQIIDEIKFYQTLLRYLKLCYLYKDKKPLDISLDKELYEKRTDELFYNEINEEEY